MKRDPVAAALHALAEIASRPHDVATLALVRDLLAHRSNHVVGRAARAAREAELTALAPDLITAFPRFLEDPVRRDPGCVAKAEIVHALLSFGHAPPTSSCAALPTCSGNLLSARPSTRRRLFVLRGDDDPGVLAEAFAGLLVLSGNDAVPFVVKRLASEDRDVARAAAIALGAARRPDAIEVIRERVPGEDRPDVRHTITLALATSRDDAAGRSCFGSCRFRRRRRPRSARRSSPSPVSAAPPTAPTPAARTSDGGRPPGAGERVYREGDAGPSRNRISNR